MKFAVIETNKLSFAQWIHSQYGIGNKYFKILSESYKKVFKKEYYDFSKEE